MICLSSPKTFLLNNDSQCKIELRDYQEAVKRDFYNRIREGYQRVLLVASTGSGKTVIAASIVYDISIIKNKKVLFVVHRDVLIKQTFDKFNSYGIHCGILAGGYPEKREAPVQIASVQTLNFRDISWFEPDIVIADEAHLTSWTKSMLQMFPKKPADDTLPWLSNLPNQPKYLGLTATPWRLKKTEGMGDVYQTLVSAPPPGELINQGYLVKPVYYGIKGANLKGVRTTAGDYNTSDLDHVCNVPEVLEAAVREWKRLASARLTIAFAVNVAHAINLAETFNNAGVPAHHIEGSMTRTQRQEIYNKLATGEIKVLCSCEALAEGFDLPTVGSVLLARPTKSMAKFWQQTGRGLRPAEGKNDCIVIDQAGLVKKFGFIEDRKQFRLTAKTKDASGEMPTKCCPECGLFVRIFDMICPCGYIFPETEKKKHKPVEKMVLLLNNLEKKKYKHYQELLKRAFFEKRLPAWAYYTYQGYYGEIPPVTWMKGAIPVKLKDAYHFYLIRQSMKHNKSDRWIELQMTRIFD